MGSCSPGAAIIGQAVAALSTHPMFSGVDAGTAERIVRFMHITTARKGQTLFRKGDEGAFLMIVLDGSVKVVSPAADGREILLNVMRSGDMFGEIALLDGGMRTADAIAQTHCSLVVLDRRDIVALIESDPRVALRFIAYLCKTMRHMSDHLDGVLFLDVPARLARALQRIGAAGEDVVSLTQRELGQIIGVSRESVNQVLRDWQCRKLVRIDKGRIAILDRAALAHMCEDAR